MDKSVVIIDCDPGWDDAMALALALASPALTTIGITTVFGNGPVDETTRNARRMTAFCGKPDVRVYPGCHAALTGAPPSIVGAPKSAVLESLPSDGALGSEDAASFIVDSASRYGRQLTIVATGPLTNVATALLRDSAAMSQIDRLAIMGGALSGGNVTDNAEFNFYSDPKAAQIAVRSRLRKSIITLETCEQLPLTAEFVTTLARRGGKLASFVAALAQERIAASGNNKAVPLYDALAVLAVLRPHIFTFADGTADVEAELPSRLGAFSFTPGGTDGPVASVALSVNARAGYEEVFRVLETGVMLPTGSN